MTTMARIADEGLVSRVVKERGAVGEGVFYPGFELGACGDGTRRVVRVAEVGQIDRLGGNVGHETILGRAFEIVQTGVSAAFVGIARVASHDVCIDIDGIHRIGDGDLVPHAEDVEDVAGIALAAVGDEDLIRLDVQPT